VNALNSFASMTVEEQIASLDDCLAAILSHYDLGQYETESINHEFNSTFKVSFSLGQTFALRINVNSTRTIENLRAEIGWVSQIKSVSVPKPQLNLDGSAVSFGWHEASGRELPGVLYSWLDGEELGDEPTADQLQALGAAMAKMHLEAANLVLPEGALFPEYLDAFWGAPDFLTSASSALSEGEKTLIRDVLTKVTDTLVELRGEQALQPIHADLHPWNAMWHEGAVSVFDFDDSGLGLPIQDLATAIYYLDTTEQDAALRAGYESVAPLPTHTPEKLKLLLLQRRLLLLNYLYETSNPEHAALITEYQEETIRRIVDFNGE
jgi:Ser/Thr protein kinase RdoA (MazF antagonist)